MHPTPSGNAFGIELESQLWHALVDAAIDAVIVIDSRGTVLSANPAAVRMFGYTVAEMRGSNVNLLMPESDARQHDGYLARYLAGGAPQVIGRRREVVGRHIDGAYIPLELSVTEVRFAGERYFMGTLRDISARKAAESELLQSQRRLTHAQEIANLGHWEWTITDDSLWWSPQIYRMFALDPGVFTPSYPAFLERVHPDDRAHVEAAVEAAVARRAPYGVDHRILLPDGEVRHVHESGEVVFDGDRPLRMTGVVQDITDRKKTEAMLVTALDEAEVLFQEIHHRVKNNLQVIAGILTLQMAVAPEAAAVLRSTEHRVRAMALVHERLYGTRRSERIDLATYLGDLVDAVAAMLSPPGVGVDLRKEIDSTAADLDTAIPCGLIVSELLTNAFKHAVVDGRVQVRVSLSKDARRFRLLFEDGGPGLPSTVELASAKGLGLRLVHILAGQLRADVETERTPARFVFTWPAKENA